MFAPAGFPGKISEFMDVTLDFPAFWHDFLLIMDATIRGKASAGTAA